MTERIRVLHIIGQLAVGGAERQLLGMIQRADRTRVSFSIVHYTPEDRLLDTAFEAAGADVRFIDKFGMSPFRFFRKLREAIRDIRPDVVHTWMYSANVWGRWAAVTTGQRAIVASDRAEVLCHNPFVHLTERLLLSRTVRLANSHATARSLERFYGIPTDRTRIIRNAVEIEHCDQHEARRDIRSELGINPDQKIVLMVARQAPSKNYPLFVRAAHLVSSRRPDVTLVGLGRQMMRVELNRMVAELGVSERIRFIDQRDDVHRWLAAADVFCLTSNDEGFPNAVLEAMCAGLPVVCTDFASACEVIPNERIGVIVPRNDVIALADAICRLLNDEPRRRELGHNAKLWVEKDFTWKKLVHEMEELYTQLARDTSRR